ncbi:hypothetical protein HMN09_01086400 [Mycena chlorophos]|uniref:Uncharacterized protein n=1 Tax=Mycena chlorophos TaxID=658473 RepID=A0A8H6SB65_MYCCL|nr:hypothetical protein HMN09_01086400 [Mycena chlorophos]
MDVISETATRLGSPSQPRMGHDLEGFFPSRLELAIDQVVETPAVVETSGDGQLAAASALLAGENLVKTPAFFYHEIGELELLLDGRQSVQVGDSAMHAVRLEAFMRVHEELFPSGTESELVGKLSAYAAWKRAADL